jgi:hypothetical protein
MSTRILGDCLAILFILLFAFIPAKDGCIRESWAKACRYIAASIGVLCGLGRLAGDSGLILPDADSHHAFSVVGSSLLGVALGLICALILSGQLMGKKREDEKT